MPSTDINNGLTMAFQKKIVDNIHPQALQQIRDVMNGVTPKQTGFGGKTPDVSGFTKVALGQIASVMGGNRDYTVSVTNAEGSADLFNKQFYTTHLDYAKARAHFESDPYVPSVGGCSSVYFRSAGIVGRNYDWYYGWSTNFGCLIEDPAYLRSSGVAALSELTVSDLNSTDGDENAYLIPFYVLDGVNASGLYCAKNVVPLHDSIAYAPATVPTEVRKDRVCDRMLVRYILDRYETVDAAVDDLTKHVEIFHQQSLHDRGFQLHYHLVDKTGRSVVLEFDGTSLRVVESDICTNFYMYGVTGLGSTLPTIESHSLGGDAPTSVGIRDNSTGLERYNIALTLHSPSDVYDALDMMEALYYSKLYTSPKQVEGFWFSELTDDVLTVDTDMVDFDSAIALAQQAWASRSRDTGIVWITCHSCAYTLSDCRLTYTVEENEKNYTTSIKLYDE